MNCVIHTYILPNIFVIFCNDGFPLRIEKPLRKSKNYSLKVPDQIIQKNKNNNFNKYFFWGGGFC